jgi:hypothetical protein
LTSSVQSLINGHKIASRCHSRAVKEDAAKELAFAHGGFFSIRNFIDLPSTIFHGCVIPSENFQEKSSAQLNTQSKMNSPDREAATSPSALFDEDILEDFFPDYNPQSNDMPTHTCECGFTSVHQENFQKHKSACSGQVAKNNVDGMLPQENAVKEQRMLDAIQAPAFTEYFPQPSMLQNVSQQHDPHSPRATISPPDFGRMHELPHDFMTEARQYPAPTLTPQRPIYYTDLLNGPSTPQQTYPQPRPGYVPANDPYLDLFARSSEFASQRLNTYQTQTQRIFPFPSLHTAPTQSSYPSIQPEQAQISSPPTRGATSSVLSLTSNKLKRAGTRMSTFLRDNISTRGVGRGRGRGRGKTPIKGESNNTRPKTPISPKISDHEISDEPATKKRKKMNSDKQAKCRQKKADNQEALESEVQRLRAIMRNLGGCGEGEPITGTNWF